MASWVTAPDGSMVNLDFTARLRVQQDSSGWVVVAVATGYAEVVTPYYATKALAQEAMANMVLGRA